MWLFFFLQSGCKWIRQQVIGNRKSESRFILKVEPTEFAVISNEKDGIAITRDGQITGRASLGYKTSNLVLDALV